MLHRGFISVDSVENKQKVTLKIFVGFQKTNEIPQVMHVFSNSQFHSDFNVRFIESKVRTGGIFVLVFDELLSCLHAFG